MLFIFNTDQSDGFLVFHLTLDSFLVATAGISLVEFTSLTRQGAQGVHTLIRNVAVTELSCGIDTLLVYKAA